MGDEDITSILKTGIAMFTAIIIVFGGMYLYSGLTKPLTVVESGSMQHSETESSIGVIDTGDIIVMISPEKKSVTSYVEGYASGYREFGDYGDVIIYYRDYGNPVIHRAILWLEYTNEGKWAAPTLANFDSDRWSDDNGINKDYNDLKGTLTITGLGWRGYTASVDLDTLTRHSGYLTAGDNNEYFDQATGISTCGLVDRGHIKAIAGLEIPWLGCVKLIINQKNVDKIPTNSIPCLVVSMIIIILVLVGIMAVTSHFVKMHDRKKRAMAEAKMNEKEKG